MHKDDLRQRRNSALSLPAPAAVTFLTIVKSLGHRQNWLVSPLSACQVPITSACCYVVSVICILHTIFWTYWV